MSVYVANAWSLFTLQASFISFLKCGLLRSIAVPGCLGCPELLETATSDAYGGKFTSSKRA